MLQTPRETKNRVIDYSSMLSDCMQYLAYHFPAKKFNESVGKPCILKRFRFSKGVFALGMLFDVNHRSG